MSAVLSPRTPTPEHAEGPAVGAPPTGAAPRSPADSDAGERPVESEGKEQLASRRRGRAQARERRALRAERRRALQQAETLTLLMRSGLHHLR